MRQKQVYIADFTDIFILISLVFGINTNGELAQIIGISKAGITQRVAKLEHFDLVSTKPTETKHFKPIYVLTKKGQQLIEKNFTMTILT